MPTANSAGLFSLSAVVISLAALAFQTEERAMPPFSQQNLL